MFSREEIDFEKNKSSVMKNCVEKRNMLSSNYVSLVGKSNPSDFSRNQSFHEYQLLEF